MRGAVGEHVVHVRLGPRLETAHQVMQGEPELGQLVGDRDGDGRRRCAGDQTVSLQRAERLCNLAHRHDDELLDRLAEQGIAYVPFFPLGGFSPFQSAALAAVAARLDATPMSVALAWLLRSPNILLIPGTSSAAHLRENVTGAGLTLSEDDLAELDKIGR